MPKIEALRILSLAAALLVALLGLGLPRPAAALESVRVTPEAGAINLTPMIEANRSEGDVIQISTAPGRDGIVRRIAVKAREAGTRPNWIVFALTNDSDEQLDRLMVAPHFRLAGSGVIWPDLGGSRVAAITASQGIRPEREESADADVFLITLDPGTTVTFVAELRSATVPQVYLWEQDVYRRKVNGLTLYKGIIIGIAGLLALFLSIVFMVKGAVIFPAAAALAWAVFGYACIDFGFFQRVFSVGETWERVYRAGTEAVLAATLLVFLFAYLNLNRWHVRYAHVTLIWLTGLAALVGFALFEPTVAAGVARISVAAVAGIGFLLVLHLATHGYDRAVMLIPTWLLLVAWVTAAAFTVTGQLEADLVQPALIGGLVLLIMLIGFTVLQHAFTGGAFAPGLVGDTERRALALTGAGDTVFDWDVAADKVWVGPEMEASLGLRRGALEGPYLAWLDLVHPAEADRYRAGLEAVVDERRGRLNLDFRLRDAGGAYHWFRLRARPVVGADGEVVRVVGTVADVTESRMAEERLLHDAVHDNLTGLPNRELFNDRLDSALTHAAQGAAPPPTLLVVDIDRYRDVNEQLGLTVGDSILLTVSRRMARLLKPQDTLARLNGDEFAVILLSERDPDRIIAFADTIRRAVTTPITYAEEEITLTASIGVVLHDGAQAARRADVLKNAEMAMAVAKRAGGDRIEVYRPTMREARAGSPPNLEGDLRRAAERGEIRMLYQPIVRLDDRTVAGFEAQMRWDHPRLGRLGPATFMPVAEETGLIVSLGVYALDQAARELAAWQEALVVDPPIFATVNVSSRQLLRHDLLHDLKTVIARSGVLPGSLKLEVAENLVMENPEYATQMLGRLRDLGAGLSLDEFGTGFSALAYLQRFPFDTLKIDQSFVRHMAGGGRPLVLRSIVRMAQELDMATIAEGVESESDAVELSQMGCEYAQGFAFGEPMSALQARQLVGAAPEAA